MWTINCYAFLFCVYVALAQDPRSLAPDLTVDPGANIASGTPVTLTCVFSGRVDTYTFLRGNTVVQTGSSKTFAFTASRSTDGTYRCRVNRKNFQAVFSPDVKIAFPPCGPNQDRRGCWEKCSCAELKRAGGSCLLCANILPGSLVPCNCADGFFEDTATGKCRAKSDCLTQSDACGPNNGCFERCSCNDIRTKGSCQICTKGPCKCRDGWFFDDDLNRCRLKSECAPVRFCPKPNEVFNPCGDRCEISCAERGKPKFCPEICDINGACVCKDGWFRNGKGDCVTANQCDINDPPPGSNKCLLRKDPGRCNSLIPSWWYDISDGFCKPFDYSGCGGNENRFVTFEECMGICVPLTCKDGFPPAQCLINPCRSASCPAFPNAVCVSDPCGRCKARFFLPKDGRELSEQDCKERTCPKPNEVFNPCGGRCEISCAQRGKPFFCQQICVPEGACVCKDGWFRNAKGDCVTANQCDISIPPLVCNKPHERFHPCGGVCEQSCSQKNKPICPDLCAPNAGSCICEEGFFRDSRGICVSARECNNDPPPGSNKCLLRKDPGHCNALIPSWWYDISDGFCKPFDYSGCGGNENRFVTFQECMGICVPVTCKGGVQPAPCFVDPCNSASCPAFPNAVCIGDPCGRCKARFFLPKDGRELSEQDCKQIILKQCNPPCPRNTFCVVDSKQARCMRLSTPCSELDCGDHMKCMPSEAGPHCEPL